LNHARIGFGRSAVGLGAPVLAQYGYARCMDDMGLDVARPEPARQPEAVTADLESQRDAFDPVSKTSSTAEILVVTERAAA
jgi:hypothetical protein